MIQKDNSLLNDPEWKAATPGKRTAEDGELLRDHRVGLDTDEIPIHPSTNS